MILQRIRYSPESTTYRMIVYGDERSFRPVDFGSYSKWRAHVHSTLPEIDIPDESRNDALIIFGADVALDDAQLRRLGLL